MKCAFLQCGLGGAAAAEGAGPAGGAQLHEYVFCEPSPELAQKMGLGYHQRVRLLKAVYGLFNAPLRWYHRVSKDLKKLCGLENTTEPCVWTFCNAKGEIIGRVLMYLDDALIACAPTKEANRS